MSGNRIGGLKVKAKLLAKDPDYYKKIALKSQDAWVRNGKRPRGFAVNQELARSAGSKGGTISRRKKKLV